MFDGHQVTPQVSVGRVEFHPVHARKVSEGLVKVRLPGEVAGQEVKGQEVEVSLSLRK